jgi:hypothetical protein
LSSLLDALEQVQSRARKRLLDYGDVSLAIERYSTALDYAIEHDVCPTLVRYWADAGAVSRSYGNAAETSKIILNNGAGTISRGYARTVPHGDSGRWQLEIPAPDDRYALEIPQLVTPSARYAARKYAGVWIFPRNS